MLAAFNRDLTGIPWVVGLTLASILASIVVLVAERRYFRRRTGVTGLGPFGRALVVWVAVFFVLALIIGSGTPSGAGFLIIPFVAATLAAGGVELARRAAGRD